MHVLKAPSLWAVVLGVVLLAFGSSFLLSSTPAQAQNNNNIECPPEYQLEGHEPTDKCSTDTQIKPGSQGTPECPEPGDFETLEGGGIFGTDKTVCVAEPVNEGGNGNGGGSGDGGGGGDGQEEVKCSSNTALSWIMCPALNLATSATGRAAEILEAFLYVNPLTSGGSGTSESVVYSVWTQIRDFANVLFIFVLLALIYSQATSTGISAYGIKKMLPKLAAGAILANLSFFLCAVAVDIFNILGAGVSNLILSALEVPGGNVRDFYEPGLFGVITGVAAELSTALVLGVALLVFLLGNFALVLLLLFVAILTLALRQALIVFLVILAPVAFALWVLPNTEQYFQKWFKLFFSLLLMYPLMMALFSASKVAAVVIRFSAGNAGDQLLASSLAVLIAASPFVLLPMLFQVGGYSLSKINQMAKGTSIGRGAQRTDKFASDAIKRRAGIKANEIESRMRNNTLGKDEDGNVKGRFGRRLQRFNNPNSRLGRWTTAAGAYRANKEREFEGREGEAKRVQQRETMKDMSEYEIDPETGEAKLDSQGQPVEVASGLAVRTAGVAGRQGADLAQARATSGLEEEKEKDRKAFAAQQQIKYAGDSEQLRLDIEEKDRQGKLSQAELDAALSNMQSSSPAREDYAGIMRNERLKYYAVGDTDENGDIVEEGKEGYRSVAANLAGDSRGMMQNVQNAEVAAENMGRSLEMIDSRMSNMTGHAANLTTRLSTMTEEEIERGDAAFSPDDLGKNNVKLGSNKLLGLDGKRGTEIKDQIINQGLREDQAISAKAIEDTFASPRAAEMKPETQAALREIYRYYGKDDSTL